MKKYSKSQIILILLAIIFQFPKLYSETKLHPVVYEGRLVYIDTTGKIVLDDDYETEFELGRIGIEGFDNVNYPLWIFPEYAYFSENKTTIRLTYGFWFIRLGDEYEVIDNNGRTIIPPTDRFVGSFSDNLAVTKIPLKSFDYIYDEKYTFVDTSGKFIFVCDCDTNDPDLYYLKSINRCVKTFKYASDFSNQRAIVISNQKFNFIDTKSNYISNLEFDDAKPFKFGFAPVKIGEKWGAINKNGQIVIEPKFTELWNFNENYARYFDGKLYGFIDTSGKLAFNSNYLFAGDFSCGYALVKLGEWEYTFIDKNGKQATSNKFMLAGTFRECFARVMINGKWGYIDNNFRIVLEPEYDFATDFRDGFAYVWKSNKCMIINSSFQVIWSYQFEEK